VESERIVKRATTSNKLSESGRRRSNAPLARKLQDCQSRKWKKRTRETNGLPSNPGTRLVKPCCLALSISAAEAAWPLSNPSRACSEEHCLDACGSLVLHVRKHMQISVPREGRAGVSELLRDNLCDTPAASAIVAAEWRKS
jgi:hypothetical protein